MFFSGGVFQGVVGKGKDLGGIILVVSIELFLCQFCLYQVVFEIFVSLICYNWRFWP